VTKTYRLQVISRKRATIYRALLRKMTYEDEASYRSPPPVTYISTNTYVYTSHKDVFVGTYLQGEDTYDDLNCRSLSTKEPLFIGLFAVVNKQKNRKIDRYSPMNGWWREGWGEVGKGENRGGRGK